MSGNAPLPEINLLIKVLSTFNSNSNSGICFNTGGVLITERSDNIYFTFAPPSLASNEITFSPDLTKSTEISLSNTDNTFSKTSVV